MTGSHVRLLRDQINSSICVQDTAQHNAGTWICTSRNHGEEELAGRLCRKLFDESPRTLSLALRRWNNTPPTLVTPNIYHARTRVFNVPRPKTSVIIKPHRSELVRRVQSVLHKQHREILACVQHAKTARIPNRALDESRSWLERDGSRYTSTGCGPKPRPAEQRSQRERSDSEESM